MREVLATEMLEALGVNTSKSFALFETGEELVRGDEPSPTRSAVLTRLSHGHIRIGSFQRHAFNRDADAINALVGYSLEHLFGEAPAEDPAENALRLFALASEATAGLAASYMAAGFVHGVLNSDNINITGESFDYGPWRFTPHWDGDFTAAYFDHYGLYAFGRQPEAIHWDLAQLAGCLSLVVDVEKLSELISGWAGQFDKALITRLLKRLGVESLSEQADRDLAAALVAALETRAVTIDRLFFDWRGGRDPGDRDLFGRAVPRARGRNWPGGSASRATNIGVVPSPARCISTRSRRSGTRSPTSDDWAPFNAKVAAIRLMGQAMQDAA